MRQQSNRISRLKRSLVVIFMLLLAFWGYVELTNLNSKQMTFKQKFLKAVYPIFTGFQKLTGKASKSITNDNRKEPFVPIYDLSIELNDGSLLRLDSLRGRKILFVNTASDCGYTAQYAELQELHEIERDRLVIIGFPSNDFKEQEKGNDKEIAAFCQKNFGVSFPLVKKSIVKKKTGQHPVYQWLTDKSRNGWTSKSPSWNFSKYLVNESGMLTHYFDPAISPSGNEIGKAITAR